LKIETKTYISCSATKRTSLYYHSLSIVAKADADLQVT